jgi:hypothetical protein
MLLDAVKTVFRDPSLLHAQYYQDERVIDYVTQVIAGVQQPEWQLTRARADGAVDSPPAAAE